MKTLADVGGLRIRGKFVFLKLAIGLFLVLVLISDAGRDAPVAGAQEAPPPDEVVDGEILVKFEPGTPEGEKREDHAEEGGRVEETIPKIGVQVVEVEGDEAAKAREYEADPDVEFAEPNGTYRVLDHGPNDPQVGKQWQYRNTGQTGGTSSADFYAFEAWHATTGSSAVPVAVLDTGIAQNHPDLAGKVVKSRGFINFGSPGYNPDNSDINDKYGHGTHVAGSVAAASDNGVGVAGTCGGCVLYNGKVLGNDGTGAWSWIAEGIRWATDPDNDSNTNDGAKVINLSLGDTTGSDTVRAAIDYAWSRGVVVVAAAGNSGTKAFAYPAAYPNVIAVAATDHNDRKARFSNYGSSWVDVAAPGAGILSTVIDNRSTSKVETYGTMSGTSMASPHVAGVAGLVWSTDLCVDATAYPEPGDKAACVRDRIEDNADPIPGTGSDTDDYWLHGRLNACKAVGAADCSRPDEAPPTVSATSPKNGATGVKRAVNVTATFSEAMNEALLEAVDSSGNSTTVTLATRSKSGNTAQIGAQVTVSSDGRVVTLNPDASLNKGTKYTVTVKGGDGHAEDLAGNPLVDDEVWSFKTGRK